MIKYLDKNLNLRVIANSGQCFRLNEKKPGIFDMMIKNKHYRIENNIYDVSKSEWKKIIYPYLDLDTDYEKLNKKIISLSKQCKVFNKKEDIYLKTCINNSKGLRILNQDKFETLISFIISQRKSIKAIKTSIERLCKICGKKIVDKYGTYYAFPTPKEILKLKYEKLESCGLGYRVPYVMEAAKMCDEGIIDLEAYDKLDDETLMEKLMQIKGVGIKVASCVMLFSYHRFSICPIDVWIKRVLDTYYKGKLPCEYEKYAGLIQQYWFNYRGPLIVMANSKCNGMKGIYTFFNKKI